MTVNKVVSSVASRSKRCSTNSALQAFGMPRPVLNF